MRVAFCLGALGLVLSFLIQTPVMACGWWGDIEMRMQAQEGITTPDGAPVIDAVNTSSAKLPGRMGYGIAVLEPGRASPYLLATSGQPVNRIRDLVVFGFGLVIDLGTPVVEAQSHRKETQSVGMRYINIPVSGDIPTRPQVTYFRQTIQNATSPVLVYAPTAAMLGTMWAAYRIEYGSNIDYAISEAKDMGLSATQESALRALKSD